jgi:signal transduction histidine kinase
MLDLYEPSMSERGLKVELRSSSDVKGFADAALLHRMVANLLDNALKHLPRGCELKIELQARDESACLTMEDNGPGFEPGVLEHIFEQRVKGQHSTGRGMGLAFVDAVARAHGGSVTAANRDSGGAKIVVTLPLASESATHSHLSVASGIS